MHRFQARVGGPGAALAVALNLVACGGVAPEARPAGRGDRAAVGSRAPEVQGERVAGEGPGTLAEAKGKVTIVDFWATHCDPCRKSFPKYQKLIEDFGGEVAVIGVSTDSPEDATKEDLLAFARATGARFPIVWDKDETTQERYAPPTLPTSYVIDREGVVRYVHGSYVAGEEDRISAEVRALLGR